MNLTPEQVFALYLAVFLAVIFGSWFIDTRRRRRWERGGRRHFICAICQSDIPATGPGLKLRCPNCNALLDRKGLRARDDMDDTAPAAGDTPSRPADVAPKDNQQPKN